MNQRDTVCMQLQLLSSCNFIIQYLWGWQIEVKLAQPEGNVSVPRSLRQHFYMRDTLEIHIEIDFIFLPH